ncbi:hypothetical protein N9I63_04070 [Hyphomicrobiales bacterium]|nr:hypothetical protein [Hyphomicrobiales bacterium]
MKIFLFIFLTVSLFAGCVTSDGLPSSRIIVDMQNIDYAKYQADLYSCRYTSAQVNKGNDAAKSGAGGALGGAIVGSLLGDSSDAKTFALLGGLLGAAGGASESQAVIDRVIKNCLRGRGYNILN